MSLPMPQNSPVEGGEGILFLISILDKEDKIQFVQEFSEDFEKQVEEGRLSRTGYLKLLRGYAPSDDRILQVIEDDERARKWLIERVKEKAKRALQIIAAMEAV